MTIRTGPWNAATVLFAVIVTLLFFALAGIMTVAMVVVAGVLLAGYLLRRLARGTVERLRTSPSK